MSRRGQLNSRTKVLAGTTFCFLMMAGKLDAGNTITYTYDELGRLTFVTDPLNGNRDYDYDKAGNRRNVATSAGTDGASEPPPPSPPGVPSPPTGLSMQLMYDCNWIASWSAPGSQTSYQFKETSNSERTVSGGDVSTGVTCPYGDPNGNKPSWIKACNANGCSSAAYF
jgi:YD repeat-containing protein